MASRDARWSWGILVVLTGAVCIAALRAGATSIAALTLTSPAFPSGSEVPKQHTCDGADRSPALTWSDVPEGTKSFALIVDDPDAPAGTWVHWVVYDLPAKTTRLPQGVDPDDRLAGGGTLGMNDFHKTGYGGPCPPAGKPHRYFFRLYALDAATNLQPRATKADLIKAIEGHVLEQAELMGTYKR